MCKEKLSTINYQQSNLYGLPGKNKQCPDWFAIINQNIFLWMYYIIYNMINYFKFNVFLFVLIRMSQQYQLYPLIQPVSGWDPYINKYSLLMYGLKFETFTKFIFEWKQGKSEGFESCDWPIVRKRPIWVKIGDALYRVTLKFDGWPWKTIGHLSFAVSSFVQHFIAIGEFKLELQSGNAHFGSNSTIFRAVSPWNLTDDLEPGKSEGFESCDRPIVRKCPI